MQQPQVFRKLAREIKQIAIQAVSSLPTHTPYISMVEDECPVFNKSFHSTEFSKRSKNKKKKLKLKKIKIKVFVSSLEKTEPLSRLEIHRTPRLF